MDVTFPGADGGSVAVRTCGRWEVTVTVVLPGGAARAAVVSHRDIPHIAATLLKRVGEGP